MTTDRKPNTYLSKSLFIRGLQCHKSLYLHKYYPELKDEISDAQEALFTAGTEVGEYAQQLFPRGVFIPYEGLSHAEQIERTEAAIENGAETIYEAAFSYHDVFVKVDILRKGSNGWEIYEVKSSTGVEDVHINDAAIQYYVLKGSGLSISRTAIVHINNSYVRNGEIEVSRLFSIEDITDPVIAKQESIHEEAERLKDMLMGEPPAMDIGSHCSEPYACDFHGHCWQHIPEDSVFDLRRRGVDKFGLYRQGIIHMKDIPSEMLNRSQKMQVEALLHKQEVIDKAAIRGFLADVRYPLSFLDFETFYSPVPLFDGTKPYQQVPFQYSLHIKENENAALRHSEFIAGAGQDPRKDLIDTLLADIPEDCTVVSYTDFEAKRLNALAAWFPEHNERIDRILENILDLSQPFNAMNYYHWKMCGSYSIKAVLPVLVPELGYDNLEVRDGGMAMDAYFEMAQEAAPSAIDKIRKALLEYCRIDTLAMVMILDRLKAISS